MLTIRGPKVIVPPEGEPLSIEECRSHLEFTVYDDTDLDAQDDAMISGWLAAAREYCERFTRRSFSRRVLEIALDRFPTQAIDNTTAIELPFGPVLEVLSVSVSSGAASSSTTSSDDAVFSPADYQLDDYSDLPSLVPVRAWPAASGPLAVKVQYLAGYGEDSDGGIPLPAAARSAILLMLEHLYRNRGATSDKPVSALPLGVHSLLEQISLHRPVQ